MNWPWRKKVSAPAVPAEPRPMFPHRMGFSLEYWRSRPDLIAWAASLYRTREFQAFASVLRHEQPIDLTIEAVRAHARLLRIMELMAMPLPSSTDEVPATFGAEKEFPDIINQDNQPPE